MSLAPDGSSNNVLLGLENGTVVSYALEPNAHARATVDMAHAPHSGALRAL